MRFEPVESVSAERRDKSGMYIDYLMIVVIYEVLAEYHEESRKHYEIDVPRIDDLLAFLFECLAAICLCVYDAGLYTLFAGTLKRVRVLSV